MTSLVKASGSNVNRLLAGGFDNPNPPNPPKGGSPRPKAPTPPRRKPKPKPRPNRPQTAQASYQLGRRLLARRKIDEAIREFTKAINKNRKFSDALYQRGYAYLLKQQNRRALDDLNRVIAMNGNHLAAYSSRATIHQRMGFTQRARADRIKVLQLKRKRTVPPARKKRKRKKKKK